MLKLAIQRNCIKPLANTSHSTEGFHIVLSLNFGADNRRRDEETETARSKYLQQSAVLKLRNDHRSDIFGVEPLIQGAAQGGVRGRQQEGCAIERARKPPAIAIDQFLCCEQNQAALT